MQQLCSLLYHSTDLQHKEHWGSELLQQTQLRYQGMHASLQAVAHAQTPLVNQLQVHLVTASPLLLCKQQHSSTSKEATATAAAPHSELALSSESSHLCATESLPRL